ncbi:MAG: hypothetical protein SPG61_00025 [Arcanobacterium sp.]|nr:hypothetical protein [Arcanobacterium sp.]
MKLKPGLHLFWRDLDRAQIGLSPDTAISLENFSRVEHSLIGKLESEITFTEFKIAAQKAKISEKRVVEILNFLTSFGAITPINSAVHENPSKEFSLGSFPQDFLFPQEHNFPGVIDFPILSPFCTELALQLLQLLPINITSSDTNRIAESDHYLLQEAGAHLKKNQAFEKLKKQFSYETKFNPSTPMDSLFRPVQNTGRKEYPQNNSSSQNSIKLAVVHSSYTPNPLILGNLLAAGTTVINLWTEENASFLGPIFEPLSSPCPNCFHQRYLASDPDWNNLAPQAFLAPALPVHPFSQHAMLHELQLIIAILIFQKENLLKNKIRGYHPPSYLFAESSEPQTRNENLFSSKEFEFNAQNNCNCSLLQNTI